MSKTGKEKTFEKSTREIVAILLLIKVLNGVFGSEKNTKEQHHLN